jgi:hypothetical protein
MNRFFIKFLVSFMIFVLTSNLIFASTQQCGKLFDLHESIDSIINKSMVAKYPKLEFVLRSPNDFIQEMRSRFNDLKKTNPEAPHLFDYSEIGIPAVEYARMELNKKISRLILSKEKLEIALNTGNPLNLFRKQFLTKEIQEISIGLQYLNDLLAESEAILKTGKINYLKSISYLYYFTRAIGHFDNDGLSLFKKMALRVDRSFQGYKQLSIQNEYSMYKSHKFELFQRKSTVSGFVNSESNFVNAFSRKDFLETIIVPSAVALDRDILMRLMSKEINIVGLTSEPVDADGFSRPGGDFWMHDLRHETGKMFEIKNYRERFFLTEDQIKKLDLLQDYWYIDLENSIAKIDDINLKAAVELMAFNYHHDRGFPLIPSLWIHRDTDKIGYALVFILTVSGQSAGYKGLIKNSKAATTWLDQFWKTHLSEEQLVLSQ